jgi:dimethylamine/trimethylamine dehydrogenase
MKLGIKTIVSHGLTVFDGRTATLSCRYSGHGQTLAVRSVVMVTQRKPNDGLYQALLASVDGDAGKLPFTLKRIGDCEAPAIIAAATYAGHKYARELDTVVDPDEPLIHDRVDVGAIPPTGAA